MPIPCTVCLHREAHFNLLHIKATYHAIKLTAFFLALVKTTIKLRNDLRTFLFALQGLNHDFNSELNGMESDAKRFSKLTILRELAGKYRCSLILKKVNFTHACIYSLLDFYTSILRCNENIYVK